MSLSLILLLTSYVLGQNGQKLKQQNTFFHYILDRFWLNSKQSNILATENIKVNSISSNDKEAEKQKT
jgi:hypothetical protein